MTDLQKKLACFACQFYDSYLITDNYPFLLQQWISL